MRNLLRLYEANTKVNGSAISFIDIDETTFHTYAKVGVYKNGKKVGELDNQQFNTYNLKDGEYYNFDEFQDSEVFNKTSKPIQPMVDKIKKLIDCIKLHGKTEKVIFLTARSDFNNKELFLKTFRENGIDVDIPNVYVERSGNLKHISSVADRKKETILKYLKTGEFTIVRMFDDDNANLKTFIELGKEINVGKYNILKLVQKKYPRVRKVHFFPLKVLENGKVKKIVENALLRENSFADIEEDKNFILSSENVTFSCYPPRKIVWLKCYNQGNVETFEYPFNDVNKFTKLCQSLLARFEGGMKPYRKDVMFKKIDSYDGYSISKEAIKTIFNAYYGKNIVNESKQLNEGIEELRKYYPKINDADFRRIIALDPTYKGGNELGKYGKWIINLYNNYLKDKASYSKWEEQKRLGKNYPEPIRKSQEQIEDFDKLPNILNDFDVINTKLKMNINNVKSVAELYKIVNDAKNKGISSNSKINHMIDLVKKSVEKGGEIVFKNNNWIVLVPKTLESSVVFGNDTNWCTTAPNGEMYKKYTKQGDLYINLELKNGELYQFHFESDQFMDKNDKSIDIESLFESDNIFAITHN
jgi:hypothetical protein